MKRSTLAKKFRNAGYKVKRVYKGLIVVESGSCYPFVSLQQEGNRWRVDFYGCNDCINMNAVEEVLPLGRWSP